MLFQLLLGLGGWTDSQRGNKYSRLVSNPQHREIFTSHVVHFLQDYGFDGLDLNWEYPAYRSSAADKEGECCLALNLLQRELSSSSGTMLGRAIGDYDLHSAFIIVCPGRVFQFCVCHFCNGVHIGDPRKTLTSFLWFFLLQLCIQVCSFTLCILEIIAVMF